MKLRLRLAKENLQERNARAQEIKAWFYVICDFYANFPKTIVKDILLEKQVVK